MILQTDAIKNFLVVKTVPDLAALYNANMEVQVIVDENGGERVDSEYKGKQFQTYTDGINSWKPIRIPYNANTIPEYDNSKIMSYDLAKYALGIGMTGYDYVNKRSSWVAYDFDAIVDHSVHHNKRISQEELEKISNLVKQTEWVTVRKSTGGNGLHLYVFIDPTLDFRVNNHNEHAALARSILDQLSSICSYDFAARVDTCGGNMWCWHKKYEANNKIGLQLIKQGSLLSKIQPDWKNHIPVVSNLRLQTLPEEYNDPDRAKLFDQLTGQKVRISLDKDHQKVINYLRDHNYYVSWDSDRWMLTTHTFALKDAHHELQLKGRYDTISTGSGKGDKNCFMTPLSRGGWVVRRFTPGTAEAETWECDNRNWTFCYYNVDINLHTASKLHKGMEDEKGKYNFSNGAYGVKAALDLGVEIKLSPTILERKMTLRESQGKLIVEIERVKDLDKQLDGWIEKPKTWLKVYKITNQSTVNDNEAMNYDDIIRHLVSEDGKDLGWVMSSEKSWNTEPFLHIKTVLEGHYNYVDKKAKNILGSNIIKPWIIVNIPFGSEYPGARTWNRDAARLRFTPNPNSDNLHYPTWLSLLNHVGQSLNDVIIDNPWSRENGIKTGADYLMCWIASLIKQPLVHLPYLFFYGPQESGKSSFHEALSRLFIRGYMRAENALRMNGNFNSEIKDAVLNVVEEVDFRKDKVAANRIKDWVTAEQLPIHEKHKTPYLVRNITHWLQCSNEKEAVPLFPGDTRITVIYVDSLHKQIPKNELLLQLEKEAPDFLAAIRELELPKVSGRLGIPIIVTEDKTSIESLNKDSFEQFLEEKCFYSPGSTILYGELFDRFKEFLPPHEISLWTKNKMGNKLPQQYVKGRLRGNDPSWVIANISLNPESLNKHEFRYIRKSGEQYLDKETINNNVNGTVS